MHVSVDTPAPLAAACCAPLARRPLTPEEAADLSRVLKAIADPARLRLLSLLASAEAGEACVCELVEPLGRSQPTVSHHLKILGDAGLVRGEKRGRWVWYRVVPATLDQLRGVLA